LAVPEAVELGAAEGLTRWCGTIEHAAPEPAFSFRQHVVDVGLDDALDVAAEVSQELAVFGILGAEAVDGNGFENADVPLGRDGDRG
jgi:hypothetical protein